MAMSKRQELWLIVFLGVMSAMAPLSTDMYLPALPSMMTAFGVTPSVIQLTLTASMAGMAGPGQSQPAWRYQWRLAVRPSPNSTRGRHPGTTAIARVSLTQSRW